MAHDMTETEKAKRPASGLRYQVVRRMTTYPDPIPDEITSQRAFRVDRKDELVYEEGEFIDPDKLPAHVNVEREVAGGVLREIGPGDTAPEKET